MADKQTRTAAVILQGTKLVLNINTTVWLYIFFVLYLLIVYTILYIERHTSQTAANLIKLINKLTKTKTLNLCRS